VILNISRLLQYLSVSGEVTFWKGIYRRHTNFAQETVEMSFNSGGAVQWGNDITCTIARTGDLMSKSWLKIVLPALNKPLNQVQYWEHKRGVVKGAGNVLTRFESDKMYNLERDPDTGLACNDGEFKGARFCDEIGHAMIDYVEISIGGTVIDKLTGHYLSVWHNLVTSADRQVLDHLIGKSGSIEELEHWAKRPQTLYVPLRFWFSNHIMCSLPLISLQYHEVKIKVKLLPLDLVVPVKGFPAMKGLPEEGSTDNYKPVTGISNGGEPIAKSSQNVPVKISLITNLVYLEEEERRQFNADCKNGRRVREDPKESRMNVMPSYPLVGTEVGPYVVVSVWYGGDSPHLGVSNTEQAIRVKTVKIQKWTRPSVPETGDCFKALTSCCLIQSNSSELGSLSTGSLGGRLLFKVSKLNRRGLNVQSGLHKF